MKNPLLLCPVLGTSEQERHGNPGAGPVEGFSDLETGAPLLQEKSGGAEWCQQQDKMQWAED